MSLWPALDAKFNLLGVGRAKNELAAEFLIRRVSTILKIEWMRN